jgi:8-oxo-dGTP diphosphatase
VSEDAAAADAAAALQARRVGRRYPDRPMVAVLAVVMRGERALIVQRANAPNQGRWGFPGGVLELGETVAEGAMRELLEETGVIAKAADTLSVFDAIDRDREDRVRHHYVLIALRGIWQSGEGVAGDDAAAVRWASRAEIVERGLWIAPLLLPLMDLALGRD